MPPHRLLAWSRRTSDEERLTDRWLHQWNQLRAERRAEVPVRTGSTNFTRAQVPWGFDLAAAWSWRLLVIAAATYLVMWLFNYFLTITLPLVISLLLAALAAPGVRWLRRLGLPSSVAALTVVLTGLAMVVVSLSFVTQQVATGSTDLADSVVEGLGQIKMWLKNGPLNASESQINNYIEQAQNYITEKSRDGEVVGRVTELGAALGHVVAGVFIILFATYFFLSDGQRIWAFFVRLAPRAGRDHVDTSGKVAWVSLTQFVRATVMVALVDALGVMAIAWGLGLPFVLAIGVLVFLGAFVPLVGAFVAGSVAVLVALVDQGPFAALIMLAGVTAVMQIEGHVLQPFLMGKFVSVHPLAVIVAIGFGVLVAGIPGALIAVPLVAVFNAVAQHLAEYTDVGEDPVDAVEDDIGPKALDPDPPEENPKAVQRSVPASES